VLGQASDCMIGMGCRREEAEAGRSYVVQGNLPDSLTRKAATSLTTE
jgi:hypothetical protein